MDSWTNGAKGSEVKRVIDNNFDILDKRTIKIKEDISKLDSLNIKSINFVESNWGFNQNLNTYTISISYMGYEKSNPNVDIYMKNEDGYSFVYGGYKISEDGIDLQSDIPYEGKVVIR